MQQLSPPERRLVALLAPALLATVLLLAGAGCAVGSEASSNQEEPAPLDQPEGRWSGSVTYTRFQGTPLLSVAYTASGDFWFTVDDEGGIHGRAVVTYQPTVDLGGLNAVLSEARSLEAGAISAFPLPIPIPLETLAQIESSEAASVRGWYGRPMYTVQREITGSYDDTRGRIALQWVDERPVRMGLDVWFDGFDRVTTEDLTGSYGQRSRITHTEVEGVAPWDGSALIREYDGTLRAVASTDTDDDVDGVTVRTGSTWSVTRG